MDNKLSELSKPVFEIEISDGYWLNCSISPLHPRDGAKFNGWPDGVNRLYSQEYVSALKHESAVNWEAAASLNVENQELKKRIDELERSRFIAWPGNMFAPVLARFKVDVKRRDGSVSFGLSAGNVIWYHSDSPSDVVAFALTVEGDE